MGITAYFYQHNKRVNSTKLPTLQTGDIALDIQLKDTTNLFSPVIVLTSDLFVSGGLLKNPLRFNYMYIPDFSRYYFIKNWTWVNGRWIADAEIDFLASYKTEIGNTTAYVLRAASEYDADLIDNKYLTKSDCVSIVENQSSIWFTSIDKSSITQGFFVVGIVNNDSGSVGAVSYYAVAGAALRVFMSQLYASPAWMNITDASISNDLQKMLINPIQYIVSCMWFPVSLQVTGVSWTTVSTIPVGWWDITLPSPTVFYKLTDVKLQYDRSLEFTIPKHPSATGAYKWLQNSPYSSYQLEFFPFGVFAIDAAKLYDFEKLRCEMKIDLMTGNGILNVKRKKSGANYLGILFSVSSQVGIPISLAQMSVDLSALGSSSTWALSAGLAIASDTTAVSDLVNNVKNVVSDVAGSSVVKTGVASFREGLLSSVGLSDPNYYQGLSEQLSNPSGSNIAGSLSSLLSSVGKVATNIGNAVLASSGVCQMFGSTGTLAQYYLDQALTLFYFDITETDPTHYGYPLSKSKKINTLSGFVLCANEGDLSIGGTAVERQAIVAAMTGGFYYE